MRTGVHKTFGRVWTGATARALGAGTIAFGIAGCAIAAIGIAIAA